MPPPSPSRHSVQPISSLADAQEAASKTSTYTAGKGTDRDESTPSTQTTTDLLSSGSDNLKAVHDHAHQHTRVLVTPHSRQASPPQSHVQGTPLYSHADHCLCLHVPRRIESRCPSMAYSLAQSRISITSSHHARSKHQSCGVCVALYGGLLRNRSQSLPTFTQRRARN